MIQDNKIEPTASRQTTNGDREPLLGKSFDELRWVVAELGLPTFSAKQISDWIYKKCVTDIAEMTNLSKQARESLSQRYRIGRTPPSLMQDSADGTRKYLFRTTKGNYIESVMIPEGTRSTLCVSSQSGCKMNCLFCMTGKQGWQEDLSRTEILNQIFSVDEAPDLTNVVLMGMGEPLDNTDEVLAVLEVLTAPWGLAMSPKRITLSTIGVRRGLERFLSESRCHLAISLHSAIPEERAMLIPSEKAFPIVETIEMIRQANFEGQRRISFEYIVFSGLNDSSRHIDSLAKLLKGIPCLVNLIRFHRIPGVDLPSTTDKSIESFRLNLERKGFNTTIRQSRGEDIAAACGMLSSLESKTKSE